MGLGLGSPGRWQWRVSAWCRGGSRRGRRVGQDVVDGDAAYLHAGFLEDLAEKCQHLVAPVVVALKPGRGLMPGSAVVEERREGGHICFFQRFLG